MSFREPVVGDIVIHSSALSKEFRGYLLSLLPPDAYSVVPEKEAESQYAWRNNTKLITDQLHKLGGRLTAQVTSSYWMAELNRANRALLNNLASGRRFTSDQLISICGQKAAVRRLRELRPLLYTFELTVDYDPVAKTYGIVVCTRDDRMARVMSMD